MTLHLSSSPEALQFLGYLCYLFFLVSSFPGRQSFYGLVSQKRLNHLNFAFLISNELFGGEIIAMLGHRVSYKCLQQPSNGTRCVHYSILQDRIYFGE